MTGTQIENGLIVVVKTAIANPEVDRRHKRDWRYAETIPAGKRFILTVSCDDLYGVDVKRVGIKPTEGLNKWTIYGSIRVGDDEMDEGLFRAVIENAEIVEGTFGDALVQTENGSADLLVKLAEMGKLSIADLKAADAALNADYDAKDGE